MKLFRKDPPPLRDVVCKSIYKLKTQQHKIEQASFRLKKRDGFLFKTCVHALKNHNKERAKICANEVAEVKKIVKFLYHVELAIERVILRLETIRELSDIIIDLKPALRVLQKISKQLFEVLPDVSSELSTVSDVINETLHSTRMTADESMIPVSRITQGGEEVIEEVSSLLEREVADKLPEPPTSLEATEKIGVEQMVALTTTCSQIVSEETLETEDVSSGNLLTFKEAEVQELSLRVEKPSLEDILFEYVRKSKGQIDLLQCSVELNASYSEIEKALQSLGDKGKVVIETEAR